MCPMRLVPKIFIFNEDNVPADLRAQRTLNLARVPEISAYLLDNRDDYTYPRSRHQWMALSNSPLLPTLALRRASAR